MCTELLGFSVLANLKTLAGQRILISWLREHIANPACRCNERSDTSVCLVLILVLLGNTIFMDKVRR